MASAWQLRVALHSPKLRVMGLFGCTHRTNRDVPLINAIYENNPAVGHTLPLLIWHPMQLVLAVRRPLLLASL